MTPPVLSPWQPEQDRIRLAALGKLIEECGELAAIAARCIIQGIDEAEPVTGKRNSEALADECADVRAAVCVAQRVLRLDRDVIEPRVDWKTRHLHSWHALIQR